SGQAPPAGFPGLPGLPGSLGAPPQIAYLAIADAILALARALDLPAGRTPSASRLQSLCRRYARRVTPLLPPAALRVDGSPTVPPTLASRRGELQCTWFGTRHRRQYFIRRSELTAAKFNVAPSVDTTAPTAAAVAAGVGETGGEPPRARRGRTLGWRAASAYRAPHFDTDLRRTVNAELRRVFDLLRARDLLEVFV